jgi:GWxTD domain-containing protein
MRNPIQISKLTISIVNFALLIINYPAYADDSLIFFVDMTRFHAGKDMSTVEIDYEIPYYSLSFREEMDKDGKQALLRADVKSTFTLKDQKTGKEKSDDKDLTIYISSVKDAEEKGQAALDRKEWIFAPGSYEFTIHLNDINSNKSGSYSTSFEIPVPPKHLFTSDIQFASSIKSDTIPTKFSKNGLQVLPVPSTLFGKKRFLLYSYLEIYNLSGDYTVEHTILDKEGKIVKKLPPKIHEATSRDETGESTPSRYSTVEVSAVNVIALSHGKYYLQVNIKDLASGEETSPKKEFTVIQESPPKLVKDSDKWEIPIWAKEYYDDFEHIATPKEWSFYKSLSAEGKKEFLNRFWKNKDPVPQTTKNEAFLAFIKRISEADSLYSSGMEKGKKTDRGRIHIKYGPPDYIERRPADIAYKPHETWSYYGGGGMQFVFLDFSGFGKYEIIYSTEEGEYTHPRWFELIDETEVERKRR